MTSPTSRPRAHPGITGVGRVTHRDHTTFVSGWSITTCATQCACHLNPVTKTLQIRNDNTTGSLGLRSFTNTGQCVCCTPWTADELEQVLLDLGAIEALTTSEATEA